MNLNLTFQVCENFDDMGLREDLLRGIFAYGFEKPSAIQQRGTLPLIKGRDTIAQVSPLLNQVQGRVVSVLILCTLYLLSGAIWDWQDCDLCHRVISGLLFVKKEKVSFVECGSCLQRVDVTLKDCQVGRQDRGCFSCDICLVDVDLTRRNGRRLSSPRLASWHSRSRRFYYTHAAIQC